MMSVALTKLQQFKRIHFVGIGGIGMSGLARVLLSVGFQVSGSDTKSSPLIDQLKQLGCPIHMNHSHFPKDAECVVYSTAIHSDNPELKYAREKNIPVLHRSELLCLLVNQFPSIGVAGTHGKTTTTSMISFLCERVGLQPLCLVGGKVLNFSDNVLIQNKDIELVVAEVDESDKSIVNYEPLHAVVTNIEEDHLDFYHDIVEIQEAFKKYVENIRAEGTLIYNGDDVLASRLAKSCRRATVSYGFSEKNDFRATNIQLLPFASSFELNYPGDRTFPVTLSVPGLHNISNCLASFASLWRLGADLRQASEMMRDFRGVGRRLEVKLERPDILVLDDYAHHPTEVKASLSALARTGRKITVVFQPHRYSRVQALAAQFRGCFVGANRVILTEIYAASEKPMAGITSDLIAKAIEKDAPSVSVLKKSEILSAVKKNLSGNDLIIFMGAGDVTELADEFARQISG